ncbi:MAG: Lrp/AsnC family transcriptional regulator [Clostridiales bacterium]|jgi:DNA-binding Lrp family transcriptional regulator|nr:Lrp/AsnC family transcriptional regulator [Clostridiales bacterium]
MEHKRTEILRLLEKDSRLTAQQIAAMLGLETDEVSKTIDEYEKNRLILGYQALVDWDKTDEEFVTALIEVKITPQRGKGFDRIAERIYQYDEVESVYLMSGGYDLVVIITGRTLKDVATFVSARLAVIDGVISTSTHFILKKYKEKNQIFSVLPEQEERMNFI